MFDLAGKISVVTGAASGIGESIAMALAAQGAFVHILDRDLSGARKVAAAITAAGGRSNAKACDVADPAASRGAASEILAMSGGRMDIVVLNAGIGHVGTALTTTPEDLDRLWSVNVKGVFHLTQALLPTLLAQRSGSVIAIASIGGMTGIRDRLAYCTSKAAVVGMIRSMAIDHAQDQVRFNAICPGRVETPFVEARLREYADPVQARIQMSGTQAIGRMGTPKEIAAAAVYLASDEAAFVTGSAFIIDGGWTAGK